KAVGLNLVGASAVKGTVNDDSYAGDANANTFNGDAGNDFLDGLTGDDILSGAMGNDVLLGGDGKDTLSGGDGADTLEGGAGNDTLQGDFGSDTLIGGEGNDILYAMGGFGGGIAGDADTLDGGVGNDLLCGGYGSQTYLFGRGDGQDSITNFAYSQSSVDPTVGKQDMLKFKAGIAASDIVMSRSGDHLILKIGGTTDQVTVQDYFVANGNRLDAIRFEDGTNWDYAQVTAMTQQGTEGNDALVGTATSDVLDGKGGNDTVYGRGGDDSISGGLGDDTLHGEAGNDVLLGDDGKDTLSGGDGADTLEGGAGNDTLQGDFGSDTLIGGEGNDILYAMGGFGGGIAGDADTLDGGVGNDLLCGGYGSQTYLFGRGDGQDSITNFAYSQSSVDPTVGKQDMLKFKAGIAASDIVMSRSGDHLILKIGGTTDQVTVQDYFVANGNRLDAIRFEDGTNWDYAQVTAMTQQGTEGNDALVGTATSDVLDGKGGNDTVYGRGGDDSISGGLGDDTLHGEAGNDVLLGDDGKDTLSGGDGADTLTGGIGADSLSGEAGNDTLDGGAGNDTMNGGLGNNTYLFGKGDGSDTIYGMNDATAGKLNVLRLKAGVAASEVRVTRSVDALVLGIAGTTDVVRLEYFFSQNTPTNSYNPVQEVRFEDGTVWDLAAIQAQLSAPPKQVSVGDTHPGYTPAAAWTDSAEVIFLGGTQPYALLGETWAAEMKPFAVDAQMMPLAPQDGLLDSQVNQLLSAMASFAPPAGMEKNGAIASAYQQAALGTPAVNWQ
ncbi:MULTISPECIES: calcium-binding protein, partial [unclassified Acidovorax]|uniref:calcium-binding protein n=1 Tax=unclassified Acidovorax TaxID=2684926 RepID=UPI001D947468